MPFGIGPLIVDRVEGSAPFTPFDEPGMLCWFNSENASLDGSNNVISYLDISGNSLACAAASTPQRPGTIFSDSDYNGHASSSWSNAADTLVVTDAFPVGDYTLVQVCKIPASVGAYLMSFSAGDYIYGATSFSMYTAARLSGGTGALGENADAGAGWIDAPNPRTFLRRMDGTSADSSMRINGVVEPMSIGLPGDPGSGPFNTLFSMMNFYTGGLGVACDGTWATSLMYDHAVSDAVAANLEGYFRTLYNHY